MSVDSLTKAFIRGAAIAATLSACGETAPRAQKLNPIPDREYPHCVGPTYEDPGGYVGQCCGNVRCTETVAGNCPSADSEALYMAGIKPPGSGACSCETDEGPFARPDAPELEPGQCCYVIYSIGCTGRPLKQDGKAIVADVSRRGDWIGGADLPMWA